MLGGVPPPYTKWVPIFVGGGPYTNQATTLVSNNLLGFGLFNLRGGGRGARRSLLGERIIWVVDDRFGVENFSESKDSSG